MLLVATVLALYSICMWQEGAYLFSPAVSSGAATVVYSTTAVASSSTAATTAASLAATEHADEPIADGSNVPTTADPAYWRVTCPPTADDGEGGGLDWRVRYIYRRQHPAACQDANYLLRPPENVVGFGAMLRGFMGGGLYAALVGGRVMMLHPADGLVYGSPDCPSGGGGGWDCYFEPITNCRWVRGPCLRPVGSCS